MPQKSKNIKKESYPHNAGGGSNQKNSSLVISSSAVWSMILGLCAFIFLLVLLAYTAGLRWWGYQNSTQVTQEKMMANTEESRLDADSAPACPFSGTGSKHLLSPVYTVVSDTESMESIARDVLKKPELVGLLVKLNQETYPGLESVYDSVKKGWRIYMPLPEMVEAGSGGTVLLGFTRVIKEGELYRLENFTNGKKYTAQELEKISMVPLDAYQQSGVCVAVLFESGMSGANSMKAYRIDLQSAVQKRAQTGEWLEY